MHKTRLLKTINELTKAASLGEPLKYLRPGESFSLKIRNEAVTFHIAASNFLLLFGTEQSLFVTRDSYRNGTLCEGRRIQLLLPTGDPVWVTGRVAWRDETTRRIFVDKKQRREALVLMERWAEELQGYFEQARRGKFFYRGIIKEEM